MHPDQHSCLLGTTGSLPAVSGPASAVMETVPGQSPPTEPNRGTRDRESWRPRGTRVSAGTGFCICQASAQAQALPCGHAWKSVFSGASAGIRFSGTDLTLLEMTARVLFYTPYFSFNISLAFPNLLHGL